MHSHGLFLLGKQLGFQTIFGKDSIEDETLIKMDTIPNGHVTHTNELNPSSSVLSTFLSNFTFITRPRSLSQSRTWKSYQRKQRNGLIKHSEKNTLYHQLSIETTNDENNNQTKTDSNANSVLIDLPPRTSSESSDDTDKSIFTLEHFLWILTVTLCYFTWFIFIAGISFIHVLLYLILISLYVLSDRTRRFALAILIYLTYLLLYDALHLVPNYTISKVHILDVYLIEKKLFGIYHDGHLMTLNEYFRLKHIPFFDVLSGICYLNWIPIPITYSLYLYRYKSKRDYIDFAFTFLLTNILGFIIYYIVPAAPPWYVALYGFDMNMKAPGSPAGFIHFDQIIGVKIFSSMYSKNANVFAAIPSLHAAYPVITVLYGSLSKKLWLHIGFVIFTLGVWFSAVYSGHHYVIDVLAGGTCALTAFLLYRLLSRQPMINRLLVAYNVSFIYQTMDIDLKQVFSILDENDEGQIQLRRFVDVANNYYSDAEQLNRITKALDPSNTGLINFEQFCDGIAQISSLQGLTLKEVASDLTRRSRENSLVEDSDRRSLNQDGSTTTFNEYDVESDEAFHPPNHKSHTSSTRTPNSTTNTKKPHHNNRNSNRNSQSLSPRLDSPFYGDDEEFTGVAEPTSSVYSPETVYPRAPSQRVAQNLKRNSYLQPVTPLEQPEQQLQETVDELQKTVETLTEQKEKTTERLAKIQSENTDLKSRLLALEDRFHDLEGQHTRTTRSEQQKYAEFITQKDRSFLQEKEILQSRINAIEAELKQTNHINGQMKKDVNILKDKLEDVDVQLQESQVRCNHLSEDNEKLLEQLRLQREELEAEKLTNAQLAEQLTSRKTTGRSLTGTESVLKSSELRIQELDAQVQSLKLENQKLKNENEELRERAVASGIDEGRRLMANPDSLSYAAELEVLSKDELMSKLRDQYSINDRLREYIERMLTVIIENNPQLLEVTTSSGVSIGSMSMSSLTSPNPRPVLPVVTSSKPSLQPTESVQSDTSSTTIKEPTDNS
ncbi:unnamed protein product [Adineta ricciae]|uniref:FIP-RBD domain-containing protein n=1 Tax=Adineta ricciae TaxID=249248 RepID=A0A815A4V7_ADIRI|nr:unnamed protein product [Adineta ricciae]